MIGRPGLQHGRVVATVATFGLVASLVVAVQDPVSAWELDLTEWINGAPDLVADLLYPVMQLGTFLGPVLAAIAIYFWKHDTVLAWATVVVGLVDWFGAKLVKAIVERDRPVAFLPDIDVRDGDGTGFGYLSGHSAVAAGTAVMVMAALPRRWRPVAAGVAALVGLARIVHGVHLPADVVGGWSFGTLVALTGLTIVERTGERAARSAGAPAAGK